jgi:hypothetical protein
MARDQLPRGFAYCVVVLSAVQRSILRLLVVTLHFSFSQFDGLRLNSATEAFGCDRPMLYANFNASMIRHSELRLPQFAN